MLHRAPQLLDVSKGLGYLHSRSVIHGDLKGVCVTADFRSSLLMVRGVGKHTSRCNGTGTNRRLRSCNRRARLKVACYHRRSGCGDTPVYRA